MEIPKKNRVVDEQRTLQLDGLFSPFKLDSAPTFWKSRRRKKPAYTQNLDRDNSIKGHDENQETPTVKKYEDSAMTPEKHNGSLTDGEKPPVASVLSEKRKALFEPLQPINGKWSSAESLLPPPDFDSAIYPQGWLIGKKRKLVNVDVVESMRRIAVQEMNRKDREIDGLSSWKWTLRA